MRVYEGMSEIVTMFCNYAYKHIEVRRQSNTGYASNNVSQHIQFTVTGII